MLMTGNFSKNLFNVVSDHVKLNSIGVQKRNPVKDGISTSRFQNFGSNLAWYSPRNAEKVSKTTGETRRGKGSQENKRIDKVLGHGCAAGSRNSGKSGRKPVKIAKKARGGRRNSARRTRTWTKSDGALDPIGWGQTVKFRSSGAPRRRQIVVESLPCHLLEMKMASESGREQLEAPKIGIRWNRMDSRKKLG